MLLAISLMLLDVRPVSAQLGGGFGVSEVGGIFIDSNGAIKDMRPQIRQGLAGTRQQLDAEVPADFPAGVQLRKISLRALQKALLQVANKPEKLPATVRYLSGLQRVQYVFVAGKI